MPHPTSRSSTNGGEPLWSRAKCNRLLRPLSLALSSQAGRRIGESDARCVQESDHQRGDQYMKDTTWSHSGLKRRQRLTYSRANRHRLAQNTPAGQTSAHAAPLQPGELVAPTPLLDKVRANVTCQNEQPSANLNEAWDVHATTWSPEHTKPRCQKMDPMEAVKVAFKTLLIQTRPDQNSPQKANGAPTFLSLCLRNIPAHIADEQEWRREQNLDDRSDVSAEVYEYLENLGCGDQEGWGHLRTVVRAHGVFLVQTCIRNQALGDSHVKTLFKICIQEGCPEEARRLCQCWIESRDPFPLPSSPGVSEFFLVELINCLTSADYNPIPQYRMLESLFKSRSLPLAWVTTPAFRTLWYKIIVSSSQDDEESVAAIDMIGQILDLATDTDPEKPKMPFTAYWSGKVALEDRTAAEQRELQSAITNTIFSLTTIVTSIACMKLDLTSEDVVHRSQTEEVEPIATVAKAVKEAILPHHGLLEHYSVTANRLIVCASDLFLSMHHIGCASGSCFDSFDGALMSLIQMNSAYNKCNNQGVNSNELVTSLLCSVIRCFGRVQGRLAFELLKRSARKMISFRARSEDPFGKVKMLFIRRLALDTVTRFTEEAPSQEHMQFLQAFEKLMGGSNITSGRMRSPQSNHSPDNTPHGLRWEEGICEWVAATPASLLKTVRLGSFSSPSRPSDATPTKPAVNPGGKAEHKPSPVNPAKHKRTKTFHKPRTDSNSTTDSAICLSNSTDNFKSLQRQPRRFTQTFEDDDSEEEDELALPIATPRHGPTSGMHSSRLGMMRATGNKARAYSGIRDAKAFAALNITELTSDELG